MVGGLMAAEQAQLLEAIAVEIAQAADVAAELLKLARGRNRQALLLYAADVEDHGQRIAGRRKGAEESQGEEKGVLRHGGLLPTIAPCSTHPPAFAA